MGTEGLEFLTEFHLLANECHWDNPELTAIFKLLNEHWCEKSANSQPPAPTAQAVKPEPSIRIERKVQWH